MKKITILGGSDGFGKWLAKYILDNFSKDVKLTITGTQEKKLQLVKKELKCNYNLDNIKAVKNSDIVIFSVPIGITINLIKQICPHIKPGSVVLDVTSIKNEAFKAMKQYSNKDVLIIPTHPMFGPFISTIAGQIIILTPEEKTKKDKKYIFLKNFLESKGSKVIEVKPKKHDEMMGIVQGLTHYNMFVLGETLKKLKVDLKESFNFVSPVYKILISFIERYVNQNPILYSDIQMSNPEILKIHKTFISVAEDFHNNIKNKESETFVDKINETKKYFGKDSISGQEYTDKIIFMISKQIEKAKNSIGKEVNIINIYSNKQISGTLEDFKNNEMHINKKTFDINTWEIL